MAEDDVWNIKTWCFGVRCLYLGSGLMIPRQDWRNLIIGPELREIKSLTITKFNRGPDDFTIITKLGLLFTNNIRLNSSEDSSSIAFPVISEDREVFAEK